MGIPCVQNKKQLIQKLSADQNKASYASVTKQKPKPKPALRPKIVEPKVVAPTPVVSIPEVPQIQTQTDPNTGMGSKSASPTREKPAQNTKETVQNRFKVPDQITPTMIDASRKSAPGGKNDGGETDDSTTSSSSIRSRRLPNKKPKQDSSDGDDPMGDSQRS